MVAKTKYAGAVPRKAVGPKKMGAPRNINAEFSVKTLEGLQDDLASGRVPMEKFTISDDMVTGLRAIVRKNAISFHVTYKVVGNDGGWPFIRIGEHPDMSIAKARKIAQSIRDLGAMGIDPQEGLHARLIREIDALGNKWRP